MLLQPEAIGALVRVGSALLGFALAVSMTAVALAQAEDDTSTPDGTEPVETTVVAPIADQIAAATLFLHVTNPVDQDVKVPLETAQLTVTGVSLPGAVVSVGGDLAVAQELGLRSGLQGLRINQAHRRREMTEIALHDMQRQRR